MVAVSGWRLGTQRDNECDVIASLPFSVRRLVFDKENAVAVIDQLRAVGKEQRMEPGFVAGGRFRRRSVDGIGWIVHFLK